MEIEDPKEPCALEDQDLVALVLQADVGLRGVEPAVLVLGKLHGAVELVEELVPQQVVLGEVELAASVPEGVVVAGPREVEPFGVAELVALEVQVALAAEGVGDEPDHLVQGHAALDDGGELREGGHVRVHFLVAQPHHEGFVADEAGGC